MKHKSFILLFLIIHSSLFAFEKPKEYNHPAILSFETMPKEISCDNNSKLSLSDAHFKHLDKSLCWKWNGKNSTFSIKKDINYAVNRKSRRIPTFVFWLYSEKNLKSAQLKVEFLRNDSVKCFFNYNLNFTGWRGAWIGFKRDMQGKPVEGMDEVRFTVPDVEEGTLFFDHIMLSSMQDIRQHTADFQAPFVNKRTTNHWLILLKSWNKDFDIPLAKKVTKKEKKSIKTIEKRVEKLLLKGKKARSLKTLKRVFNKYNLQLNKEEQVSGVPIFFERYGETYEYLGAERYNKLYNNPMGLKKANRFLLDLACTYHLSEDIETIYQVEEMFTTFSKHMLDQGFQAGSGMGTLHHLGYSMREYYVAMFLMRDVLEENNLKEKVQQSMEWFAGTGEVKRDTKGVEMDVDAFNTNLIARLTSILMIDNWAEKTRYLYGLSRWVDNGYKYADGTRGSFKSDGCIYHHRHNYPAYAVGGLEGAVSAVYLLRQTPFKVSEESHQILKNSLLAMRTYCNLRNWPLSLSGRHPNGRGELRPKQFGLLALAGTPNGKEDIDKELASAYLRLTDKKNKMTEDFENEDIKPELSPSGNWSFPYSCLDVHRRDNWMISAMGHSRYLWAAETYRNENMYGRYLTHGALQILATGNPISSRGSGFVQEGWNWNYFPGTTTTVLPIEELKARPRNLDAFSGFEEMLLSDEAFAGGISLNQKQGAFAMKLHEHDKYNGSLRARKSVFFFDNRVVALGTNIESALPNDVKTTLFQVCLSKLNMPFYINGTTNTQFPYQKNFKESRTILSDGLNNYFFVKNGKVEFKKSNQHSFDQETCKPTQNNFALATINHGGKLKNGRYEYMILVQPNNEEVKFYVKEDTPYTVFQQDSNAHIVFDKKTKVTGYVFFELGKNNNENLIVKSTDTPCLIMTDKSNSQQVKVSVADPDLRFYEGKSDERYDKNGKRMEQSVYSRKWKDNPSKQSKVHIVVRGTWKLKTNNENITVAKQNEQETVLEIKCREGKSQEFTLIK